MKSFLIGFEYNDENNNLEKDNSFLPGIPIDLYQAYSSLKDKSDIIVFTDVIKDKSTSILKQAILDSIVDSGLLSFIEDIKKREQYIEFKSYTQDNNFRSTIVNSVKDTDKLFIYYTGHSKNGNMILPNGSYYSMENFLKTIVKNTSNNCQIIIITDCCNATFVKLPFYLNDGIYRLSDNPSFISQKVICISSSNPDEKSSATMKGSLFTRYLIPMLENKMLSLQDILEKIRKKIEKHGQTSEIYTSYPEIKIIWEWFYRISKSGKSGDIDIESCLNIKLDQTDVTIEIKR